MMAAKIPGVTGNLIYEEYCEYFMSYTWGKIDYVRSMNMITLQGSTRIVISDPHAINSGKIEIPEYLGKHTKIITCSNGIYTHVSSSRW